LAVLTYEETLDYVDELVRDGRPAFFITANLHYAMLTDRDPRLRRVNEKAALIVADGMPMVWYSRLRGCPLPQRVTGADLVYSLCQRAAERDYAVFLLGGVAGVADRVAEILRFQYPGLRIVGTAAPELDGLSPQEHQDLIARIRDAAPQLLLVALGQPKGELWLAENCEALGVPACVQVGASFDFVARRLRRAPAWMQRIGLEWLFRVWCEPRRLLPRYLADARFLLRAVCRDVFKIAGTRHC
jgi:N-acetylglucosaminyldiphosphoundecaprenol N-acetyl-beta-D-mannosaminyltransferase